MIRQPLLVWIMLVLVALALVAPSFVGWHHDDDLQNMRWVLEYRDAPWRALTDRHEMHDHVRPATHWAGWLGSQISNGAWWGTHLVTTVLLFGAWMAMAALVSRLVDSRIAGLLTAALILDLEGFRMILDWDSWVNTAGEVCFGLLGLLLVHRVLERGAASQSTRRSLVGAYVCMLIAGLFKEPGWVIYPGTAALMAVGAWRRGDGRRTPMLVLGLLVMGLAGFLWSHTSANVDRLGSELSVLGELSDLQHALRPWADVWPAQAGSSRGWKGLALPLIALAFSGAVVLRRRETPTEAQGRAIILGTVLITGLGYVRSDSVGLMVGLGVVAMTFVHRSGLIAVLVLLNCGVMFLFPGPNPVQILVAGMAFAGLVGVHSARLVRPGSPQALRLFAGIVICGALGLQALQFGDRLVSPAPSPRDAKAQIEDRDQLMAEGALFLGLDAPTVFYSGELGAKMLGPLVGFQVLKYNPEFEPYSLQVEDTLWVTLDDRSLTAALVEPNLLDASQAGGHSGVSERSLSSGYYVAGMSLARVQAKARLVVTSPCMDDVLVQNTGAGSRWIAVPFRVPDDCDDVEVETEVGQAGGVDTFFLTRLPEPQVDLRSAEFHDPLLGLAPVQPPPEKR